MRSDCKILIIILAVFLSVRVFLGVPAMAQTSLPNYDQLMKSLPAPVNGLVNSVKQTVDSQAPSAQNVNLSSQNILTQITYALNWLDKQFKDLTGISFSYLWATVINFLIWLVKLVVALIQDIISFVAALSKK